MKILIGIVFFLALLGGGLHAYAAYSTPETTAVSSETGPIITIVDSGPCNWFCSTWDAVKSFFLKLLGKENGAPETYPEIQEIINTQNVDARTAIYTKLIERIGVDRAQEALYHSGLPFTGETHLVQHAAGLYIYQNYGLAGISHCTLYFLAACYHEFIIELLSHEGPGVLPQVMEECWKHGPAIATQCAHGIGHGFVTFYDYANLPTAAAACDELATKSPNFPRVNCLDGVFMENLWALHPGASAPERWIKPTDPFYPCDDPRIKPEWQEGCWLNQASVMYQLFGQNLKKVSDYCDMVKDEKNKETCFDNLSRQIHPLTEGKFEKAIALCGQIDPYWKDYCLNTIATSDFSVGGRVLPYQICSAEAGEYQANCYRDLIGQISVYSLTKKDLNEFCAPIMDESYKTQCLSAKEF